MFIVYPNNVATVDIMWLQASAVSNTKNELNKKLERAVAAQDGLRTRLQVVRNQLQELIGRGHLPGFLKGLLAAHEEGGSLFLNI